MVPLPGLYVGRTAHMRFKPFEHRLAYDIYQILVDIDAVEATTKGLKWLTYNRLGWLSFFDKDHGDRSGARLRPWVEEKLKTAGIDIAGGPIRLLAFPRVLGYVFNPISVFFAWHQNGQLAGVVYEVNNTFGNTHAYVAPATGTGIEYQSADKRLHVSPFFDVSGRYAFTLRGPGENLSLVIDKYVDGVRDHLATLKARWQPMEDAKLRAAFFSVPFLTLKVIAAIHWEAIKLLFKGARYHDNPPAPAPSSVAQLIDTKPNSTALKQ